MAAIWADNFVKNELASWEDRSGTRLVRIHSEVLEHWLFFFFFAIFSNESRRPSWRAQSHTFERTTKACSAFFFCLTYSHFGKL